MAYYNKYKFTFATRANKTAYLYLQEDLASAPTVIEYPGKNLNLQYIPNSDDPFEPIFASQLGVTIDVTDNIANIPDLTTLNDRKYFAILYLDANIEWSGWVLSDGASISYSTGRKTMSFNAIDGLGMLDKIPLSIAASTDINSINTLLYFIRLCLNSNGFPANLNIMTVCSYYATGMQDRTTYSYSEPFIQTYLPYRTFIDKEVTYISCLTVLSNIVKSFGCRLFQAGGKWWIVAVNQFANQNNWYTEYTSAGSVAASGSNLNTLSTIQSYAGNTSGLYFIDNSQTKLLKKGFNRIEDNYEIAMADNYISNGNFRPFTGLYADNWQINFAGIGSTVTIVNNVTDSFAQYRLITGNTSVTNEASIEIKSGSYPKIPPAVVLEFSWIFQGQDLSASPRGFVYVLLTDGTANWWWNGTAWATTSQSYTVPAYSGAAGGDGVNSFSFKTAVTPIAGELHFKYALENGTGDFAQLSNMKLNIISSVKSQSYYSYKTTNLDYVKTIDIPYGAQSGNNSYPIEKGMFMLSNNNLAVGWYEFGGATTYGTLLLLLMQKYINIYGFNIINLDCDLSSFSTANGILNASKLFKATDTDPSSINIASNSYMLGNSTTSYAENTTNATLLQISNTTISATIGYETSFNDLI
jgi:hypothetical protein